MRAVFYLLIAISMVSVQLGASLAKTLFPVIGSIPTVMLRITIAAVILVLVFRPWRTPLSQKAIKAIVLYGGCLGLMNLTFYLALTRVPLGICVALEFTGPLAVALLASKRKIDLLWAFLAALGIVLILPLDVTQESLDPIGILLSLAAGICWGLYIVFGKKVGTLVPEGVAASLGMIVASLVALPFGIAMFELDKFTPNIWLAAIGIAVLSSAIPYSIEMFAMKKISMKTFGILMSLEPAMAAMAGLLILGELLTPIQWLAIVCVIIASAGSARTSRVAPNAPEATPA